MSKRKLKRPRLVSAKLLARSNLPPLHLMQLPPIINEDDISKPCQATDWRELRRQIMSSTVPKNEREHWAARRIEELERVLSRYILVQESGALEMTEDDWIEARRVNGRSMPL